MDGRDSETGRFLPGNRAWEARSSAGAKPTFSNPDDLWIACTEYFDWVERNPFWEARPFAYEGCVTVEPVAKMRAMTIGGLCLFLDVGQSTWHGWKKTRPDLLEVITRAEETIREQKFGGAAAGLLNANIISRDLGLADKSEHAHGVTDTFAVMLADIRAKGSRAPLATSDDDAT